MAGELAATGMPLRTRTWPAPSRHWAIRMTWEDLLFAHWPLKPCALRSKLPPGVELDTFDGQAWIGIVPFRMTAVRARHLPRLPGLTAFPELNLAPMSSCAAGRACGFSALMLRIAWLCGLRGDSFICRIAMLV